MKVPEAPKNEHFGGFRWRDLTAVLGLIAALTFVFAVYGAPRPENRIQTYSAIADSAAFTVGTATIDTPATPTTGSTSAQAYIAFDTVAGSFTTCTMQAKTSIDGTNYLTLGGAANVTITSTTKTYWAVLAQAPSTSAVTTSTPSTSAALGFGALTKFTIACSGGYGTSAPGTLTVVYK